MAMKIRPLRDIWQEDKRFLLTVGGGLAAFLILKSCAVDSLLLRAGEQRVKNHKLEGEVVKLRDEVFQRAGQERKSLEDLVQIEKDLRSRFLTAPPQNVPDSKRGAPQIQFSERIDKIWTDLRVEANKRNVKIPEKITTNDLGVSAGDTPADLEREAAYLEILGRALRVCLDKGMVQLERPVILQEEPLPLQKNDDVSVVYRRVGLTVHGPYQSYCGVFREFQSPGSLIQVRLLNLDPKGAGSTSALRGQLEFVGIDLLKAGEGEEPGKPAPKEAKPKKRKVKR
jgi:hypothetical protein